MKRLKIELVIGLWYFLIFFMIIKLLSNPERVCRHIIMERKIGRRHGKRLIEE